MMSVNKKNAIDSGADAKMSQSCRAARFAVFGMTDATVPSNWIRPGTRKSDPITAAAWMMGITTIAHTGEVRPCVGVYTVGRWEYETGGTSPKMGGASGGGVVASM